MEVIHNDIVNIWIQDDRNSVNSPPLPSISTAQRNQYLTSHQFKIDMSHIVKDLGLPAGGTSAR